MTSGAVAANNAKPCAIAHLLAGAGCKVATPYHDLRGTPGRDTPERTPGRFGTRRPLMSQTTKLLMEKDAPIGWIVFNQPEKRNAVSQEMWEAMPGYVDELTRDDAIRVVILRGAGDQAFVAGADISQFKDRRRNMADEEGDRRVERRGRH